MRRQVKIIFFFILFASFLPIYTNPFLCGIGYAEKMIESHSAIASYGTGAQYYVYLGADKGLQINVQIWGQVLRSGMYSVPKATDIIGLISFAGGPTENANISKIKLVRNTPEPEVIMVDLREYMNTGDANLIPMLKRGDTIVVPENVSYWFSNVVRVVSQLAIVANVYYLFFKR